MAKKTVAVEEWTNEVISEWRAGDKAVWRAQVSTSPKGDKFASVRKYATKANGEEIMTTGITLPLTADTGASLTELATLFTELSIHVGKPKEVVNWLLRNSSSKFFLGLKGDTLLFTKNAAKAKSYKSKALALAAKRKFQDKAAPIKLLAVKAT